MLLSNKIFICSHKNTHRNAFLGLILIVCVIPISIALLELKTPKATHYVEYEDQEYAENKYLGVGPMRKLKKILYKSVPVNESSVCNLTNSEVTEICHEIAIYKRSRNVLKNPYMTQEGEEPEDCKEYKLKLGCDQGTEKKDEMVIARQCPTDPPLFISDGKNIGGLFVYALRTPGRKQIILIDYITFVQRTNYEDN